MTTMQERAYYVEDEMQGEFILAASASAAAEEFVARCAYPSDIHTVTLIVSSFDADPDDLADAGDAWRKSHHVDTRTIATENPDYDAAPDNDDQDW